MNSGQDTWNISKSVPKSGEVAIKLKIPLTHFWPNSLSPTGNLCYYARYSVQFRSIDSKRVLQVRLIYILKSHYRNFFVTSPFSRYKLDPSVFTLSAMGGPSPLWGWKGPLFRTQNNTRALRAETSPQEGPVIVPKGSGDDMIKLGAVRLHTKLRLCASKFLW